MTDELIEQIKRDREAGTPGLWVAPYETYDNGWVLDTDFENSYVGIGPACESEDMSPIAITAVEMAFGMDDVLDANARRIARVPEMEARILSDADEITRLRAELAAAREQVAGARLAAADGIKALAFAEFDIGNNYEGQLFGHAMDKVLCLTPADATAALEARDARVRAEERAKVAELVSTMETIAKFSPAVGTRVVADAAITRWKEIDALHTDESRKAAQPNKGK